MRLLFILTVAISAFALSGCLYRMPNSDDVCVVPKTNNPQITRERPHQVFPSPTM